MAFYTLIGWLQKTFEPPKSLVYARACRSSRRMRVVHKYALNFASVQIKFYSESQSCNSHLPPRRCYSPPFVPLYPPFPSPPRYHPSQCHTCMSAHLCTVFCDFRFQRIGTTVLYGDGYAQTGWIISLIISLA